ncbi:MAG: hypothetical protein K0S55_68 [Clostridia bacterium]|nr:hypothetical protein [Clostridia bacterium]
MEIIKADFSKIIGKIKPLHGVNNGPKTRIFSCDMSKYFIEAGIPYSRLHDTEYPYGSGHFVDIPCIFPNFDADPEDPLAYDFTLTDEYIKAIVDVGTKVFYRLGVSIEHASKKYNIYPPKDFDKWAKICAGIIKHYNKGWADGFNYEIEYWEIWNEPENPPMWQGTKEEYFMLYAKTSKYLKSLFPHIKIGGYASCGFYSVTRENTSEFYKSFTTFFLDFLQYISAPEINAPLDFFSWHLYTDNIEEMAIHGEYAEVMLKKYGFDKTENIINEWNYINGKADMFEQMKNTEAAAFIAGVFCALQKSPVDMGAYYDAQPAMQYCGIFNYNSPQKPFYSFKAFNSLYKLQNEVSILSEIGKIYVSAACNLGEGAILLSNYNGKDINILIEVSGFTSQNGVEAEYYLIDDENNLEFKYSEIYNGSIIKPIIKIMKNTVILIKLKTL